MRSPQRYVTVPWLLKQRTGDLVFIKGWLLASRWTSPKRGPHLNQVMAALVGLIDVELCARDPRRRKRSTSDPPAVKP